MLDLVHEPDLGYVFYPLEIGDHPGCRRMDVIIQEKPTNRHYDPEKAQYHVAVPTGNIEHLTISHPWALGTRYRVCAGRIILSDRKGKRVEAFSFGGDLQILSASDHTVCGLQSTAPIFPLFTTADLPMWITAEAEILLAQQKAHWDPTHPHVFEEKLVQAKPFLLYASCLKAIQDKAAEHFYSEARELAQQGVHFVDAEIRRLRDEGRWPKQLPTPAQLLC